MVAPRSREFENHWLVDMAVARDQQHRQVGDIKQPHQRAKGKSAQSALNISRGLYQRDQLPCRTAQQRQPTDKLK